MNRRSERASRVREEAKQANRQAEQERQAQGQTTTETFTTTFTFSDGTSRTQEFQTEKDQQRSEELFSEGRRRGTW